MIIQHLFFIIIALQWTFAILFSSFNILFFFIFMYCSTFVRNMSFPILKSYCHLYLIFSLLLLLLLLLFANDHSRVCIQYVSIRYIKSIYMMSVHMKEKNKHNSKLIFDNCCIKIKWCFIIHPLFFNEKKQTIWEQLITFTSNLK